MIDDLIEEIASEGWLFNNCYQVDAALWRVNLRRPDGEGDWFTDWAEAPTLGEALELCVAKMAHAEFILDKAPSASIAPKVSLAALLKRPPKPPIRRI